MVSDFMKGRYNLMIYVGIDIAKLNHFTAAISSDGEILIEPFKFINDADGFQLLISKIDFFDKNSIFIGLESRAHYADTLVQYPVTELYQVFLTLSNPVRCEKIMFAKLRQIRSIHMLLLKLFCCRITLVSSVSLI